METDVIIVRQGSGSNANDRFPEALIDQYALGQPHQEFQQMRMLTAICCSIQHAYWSHRASTHTALNTMLHAEWRRALERVRNCMLEAVEACSASTSSQSGCLPAGWME